MKTTAVFLALICCAVSALSLDKDAKISKPSATVSPAQDFSPSVGPPTSKPNATTASPNATTAAPNVTTIAPNATTIAPNATTIAPNATTIAPNATTIAPNATTTAPNTTTTAPNATTLSPPGPTPPTNLTVGNYSLKTGNKTCLMAQMALQIRLEKASTTFKVQPENTKPDGGCEKTTANLTLSFKEGFITFMFIKSTANHTVYVNELSFNISYSFNGANGQYIANNKSVQLFPAKVGHSYSCKNESIYMGNGLYLDVSQDQMQAFNLTHDKEFGLPDSCAADKPDYSVAIGVGVALLVLIVIVVVVYIVSRKKRTDGYQSL